jgi:hypothetical protein
MNIHLREYAKETGKFLNVLSDMPLMMPVVAPGMAVNIYASKRAKKSVTTRTFLHTSDFDITVFMKRKVCTHTLRQQIGDVFARYDAACKDFVKDYTKRTGVPASLVKKCLQSTPGECRIDITRMQGAPFFVRHVYAVKQYFVKTPEETHELMDVVVAYQEDPLVRPTDVREMQGFHLPTIGYLVRELWKMIHVDILGTNAFNKKRHPVTGKDPIKGYKDLYRLRYVLTQTRDKRYDKYRATVKHLINILNKKEYTDEKKEKRIKDVLLKYHETPTRA